MDRAAWGACSTQRPTGTRWTIRSRERMGRGANLVKILKRRAGLEPTTPGLEGQRSTAELPPPRSRAGTGRPAFAAAPSGGLAPNGSRLHRTRSGARGVAPEEPDQQPRFLFSRRRAGPLRGVPLPLLGYKLCPSGQTGCGSRIRTERPSGYEPDELPDCSIPRRISGAARRRRQATGSPEVRATRSKPLSAARRRRVSSSRT